MHVARGAVTVNDVELQSGDALKLSGAPKLSIGHGRDEEVLVFDLP